MSELTEALRTHGQQHRGADLGRLLQWAALHIESQDDALSETREELTDVDERSGIIAAQRMGAHSTQAQTSAYIRNKKAIKSTATR